MRPLAKSATALVAEAKAGIENLTPAQVAAELGRPGVVVVDLRERDEVVRDGHIEGAVHVPRGLLEFVADPSHAYHNAKLNPDARVILHCASGGRSALAARTLKDMGYFVYGLDERGDAVWNRVDWAERSVMVMGAEGAGLHELVRKNCDMLVRIPMAGKIASLNVSVATGVVLFGWRAKNENTNG